MNKLRVLDLFSAIGNSIYPEIPRQIGRAILKAEALAA